MKNDKAMNLKNKLNDTELSSVSGGTEESGKQIGFYTCDSCNSKHPYFENSSNYCATCGAQIAWG